MTLQNLISPRFTSIIFRSKSNRIAIADENSSIIDRNHIFNEKVGIFTDADGNKLVFSGSNNESVAGWEYNVESFHVYCGWEGGRDAERVDEEVDRFDRLWQGFSPNVSIFSLPEAVLNKLLTHAPKSTPVWNHQIELDLGQLWDRQIQLNLGQLQSSQVIPPKIQRFAGIWRTL